MERGQYTVPQSTTGSSAWRLKIYPVSNQCCQIYLLGHVAFHQHLAVLPEATLLEKLDLLSSAPNNYKYLLGYGWCVVSSSPLHAGVCSGLGLLSFCVFCHNCYDFTCTADYCAQKTRFPHNLTSPLVTYTLFMSSFAVNCKPWKEQYGTYFFI